MPRKLGYRTHRISAGAPLGRLQACALIYIERAVTHSVRVARFRIICSGTSRR